MDQVEERIRDPFKEKEQGNQRAIEVSERALDLREWEVETQAFMTMNSETYLEMDSILVT